MQTDLFPTKTSQQITLKESCNKLKAGGREEEKYRIVLLVAPK